MPREWVAFDQFAIQGVVEELPSRLLGIAAMNERPCDRLVSADAVERSIREVTDQRPQRLVHPPFARIPAPNFFLCALPGRPGHRDPLVLVDDRASSRRERCLD